MNSREFPWNSGILKNPFLELEFGVLEMLVEVVRLLQPKRALGPLSSNTVTCTGEGLATPSVTLATTS